MDIKELESIRRGLGDWAAANPASARRRDLRLLVELAVGTGMRLGELLAVRPMHVDLEERRLLLSATAVEEPGVGAVLREMPKSSRHARYVDLPDFAVAALREAIDMDLPPTVTVFHDPQLAPLRVGGLRSELRRFAASAGVEPIRFHEIRRTVAAHLALELGAEAARDHVGMAQRWSSERPHGLPRPRAAAEVLQRLFGPGDPRRPLGHADVTTTERHYGGGNTA